MRPRRNPAMSYAGHRSLSACSFAPRFSSTFGSKLYRPYRSLIGWWCALAPTLVSFRFVSLMLSRSDTRTTVCIQFARHRAAYIIVQPGTGKQRNCWIYHRGFDVSLEGATKPWDKTNPLSGTDLRRLSRFTVGCSYYQCYTRPVQPCNSVNSQLHIDGPVNKPHNFKYPWARVTWTTSYSSTKCT